MLDLKPWDDLTPQQRTKQGARIILWRVKLGDLINKADVRDEVKEVFEFFTPTSMHQHIDAWIDKMIETIEDNEMEDDVREVNEMVGSFVVWVGLNW